MGFSTAARAAALVALATPVAAAAQTDWKSAIIPNGWEFGAATDDTAMYYQRQPDTVANRIAPRLWLRFEFQFSNGQSPAFNESPVVSMVELEEFDCAQQRARVLQLTNYSRRNMNSPMGTTTSEHPQWIYMTPNSMGALALLVACAKAYSK